MLLYRTRNSSTTNVIVPAEYFSAVSLRAAKNAHSRQLIHDRHSYFFERAIVSKKKCPSSRIFADNRTVCLKTHPDHVGALEQFNAIFSHNGEKIRCEICNTNLKWETVRDHEKHDTVVAWQDRKEKFKILFENRIVASKTQYYCCLCEITFFEWSTSLAHLDNERHKRLVEKSASLDKILFSLVDSVTDELLVTEALVPRDSVSLECKICNNEIVQFVNALRHVDNFYHQYYRLKFYAKSLRINDAPVVATELREKSIEVSKKMGTNEEEFVAGLKKPKNLEVPRKSIDTDVSRILEKLEVAKKAETAEVREKMEKDEIPWNLVSVDRSKKFENLEVSVKSKEPDIPKKPEVGDVKKKPEHPRENVTPKVTGDYCLARESPDDWLCKICEKKISVCREIEDHVAGEDHERAMRKHGCESITRIDVNTYFCECCRCKVPGTVNLRSHVMGKRHKLCLSAMRRAQRCQIEDPTRASKSELSRILSGVITEEFSKLLEKLSSTSSSARSSDRRRLSRIMSRENVARMQNVSCNFCHVVVTNSAELHSHLANHLSLEFFNARCRDDESAERKYSSVIVGDSAGGSLRDNRETKSHSDDVTGKVSKNGKDDKENRTRIKYPACINFEDETSDSEGNDEDDFTSKKTIMQRVVERLDFDNDYIYDTRDKLRAIELGMRLCFVDDSKNIYCLVCRKTVANTLQCYFEHLFNLEHSTILEDMESDDSLFDQVVGQFSELQLAREYMEELSDRAVRCFICSVNIDNNDSHLREHIDDDYHETTRDEMHNNARKNFDHVKICMQCDWYNVQKYWCVPCSANFHSEVRFVKHLESLRHKIHMRAKENIDKKLIYDFCPPCGLLWYGYRRTYAYHCDVTSHKWLLRDGHYSLPDLPESAKNLLACCPEKYASDRMKHLDEVSAREREKESSLIKDLEEMLSMDRFLTVKAYAFGSRVSGLGSTDSDFDVLLDFGNLYDGKKTPEDNIERTVTAAHEVFSKYPTSWDTEEPLTNCRVNIIRAHHRPTGLSCNIFFENKLSVETTKLIKLINETFPPCRKMIHLLKEWLKLCNLSGYDRISNYAIYWFVIFYLQKESIIPSIASLVALKDWEVGVSHEFEYNVAKSNFSFKELLTRFFTFYADFDFRHNVACPLIGEVVKKRSFVYHNELPKEFAPYVAHMKSSVDPEPLRVDSPMCIQDPFNLRRNLTKAVSKVYLSRFRTYCSKSLDVLRSSQI